MRDVNVYEGYVLYICMQWRHRAPCINVRDFQWVSCAAAAVNSVFFVSREWKIGSFPIY